MKTISIVANGRSDRSGSKKVDGRESFDEDKFQGELFVPIAISEVGRGGISMGKLTQRVYGVRFFFFVRHTIYVINNLSFKRPIQIVLAYADDTVTMFRR